MGQCHSLLLLCLCDSFVENVSLFDRFDAVVSVTTQK